MIDKNCSLWRKISYFYQEKRTFFNFKRIGSATFFQTLQTEFWNEVYSVMFDRILTDFSMIFH